MVTYGLGLINSGDIVIGSVKIRGCDIRKNRGKGVKIEDFLCSK